jgi:hypothetical protein
MCRPRAGEANQLCSVYIALWRSTALAKIYNVVGRQRNLGLHLTCVVLSHTYTRSTSGGDIYCLFVCFLFAASAWNKKWKNPNENIKYEHGMWSRMLYRTIDCVVRMQTSTWITGTCSRPFVTNNFNPTMNDYW